MARGWALVAASPWGSGKGSGHREQGASQQELTKSPMPLAFMARVIRSPIRSLLQWHGLRWAPCCCGDHLSVRRHVPRQKHPPRVPHHPLLDLPVIRDGKTWVNRYLIDWWFLLLLRLGVVLHRHRLAFARRTPTDGLVGRRRLVTQAGRGQRRSWRATATDAASCERLLDCRSTDRLTIALTIALTARYCLCHSLSSLRVPDEV